MFLPKWVRESALKCSVSASLRLYGTAVYVATRRFWASDPFRKKHTLLSRCYDVYLLKFGSSVKYIYKNPTPRIIKKMKFSCLNTGLLHTTYIKNLRSSNEYGIVLDPFNPRPMKGSSTTDFRNIRVAKSQHLT